MPIPRLLAVAAAVVAAAAVLILLPGAATATNAVLPFSGSYTPPACSAPFDFAVGAGTKAIDVAATTDVPANDIILNLVHEPGATLVASSDTATSPEAVHYAPGGDIPVGTYGAVVCPFGGTATVPVTDFNGTVALSEAQSPSGLPNPPVPGPTPAVSFNTSAGIAFAPATLVSAHFLCGEPQETVERPVANTQAGRIDANRIFADCPLTSRSQTSLLNRSTDGGASFRLLLDPACSPRNRANCLTMGGGDSEDEVNLVTGTVLFADQEGLVINEGIAGSTDHGDTFPVNRQFAITNTTTATDRQWLAWVDPRNATVGGQGLDGFFTWHLPGAGQYVVGITQSGLSLPQPVPQIPSVGQSGQVRVDNSDTSPGRGWIYQPFGTFPPSPNGIAVATAFGPQYQDPTAWRTTMVSSDTRQLFPWVAIDQAGNAYLAWIDDVGKAYVSASPIADPRNDPRVGGRPGTYWTHQTQMNPPGLTSTALSEVTAGADGRIAIGYYGTGDCAGQPDGCPAGTKWNVYVDVIPDATQLWKGGTTNILVGQVSHRFAHTGNICTAGTTCGTTCTQLTPCNGDRSLLDMMDVNFDSAGRVSVVYMDNYNTLGNIIGSSGGKNGPFVEFSKEVSGPSLTSSTPVDVTIPPGGRADPAGDATWPNTAAGQNLKSLDLLGASISNTPSTLTATVNLADSSPAQMGSDLATFNSVNAVDTKARIQYIVRLETATDVYHLDLEYSGGNLRYFGGKVDANDAVGNGTGTTVGSRYLTDAGYDVTGSLANGQLTLSIPLSELGLGIGDKVRNVAAFATAAPTESDSSASLVVNSARTVDATPPFDATIAPPPSADIAVSQVGSPNPVKKGKAETFTITVSNNGPSAASGISLIDTLPANTTFKSVTASQGSCGTPSTTVSCSLGGLANGASATVTLVVAPNAKGTITNKATAHASSPADPSDSNNTASATVTVN
jgi:uncharacterized repeat protein (TIGR01451 family)